MTEEEKQKVIETINKRKPEVRAWLDRDAQKDYSKDDKCGYKAWYVDEVNGIRSIKSQIWIKKPMKEVYDYVTRVEKKSTYDHMMDHAKLINKFGDNYQLIYFNYKGKFLIEIEIFMLLLMLNMEMIFLKSFVLVMQILNMVL